MARHIAVTITSGVNWDSKDSRTISMECPDGMTIDDMRATFAKVVLAVEELRDQTESWVGRFAQLAEHASQG